MDAIKQQEVSLSAIEAARAAVNRFLSPTPLYRYESLSRLLDADVWVKHENHQPTGSFKIRGGINLLLQLKQAGAAGVVTFSTGNHALSIATAARWVELPAVVVVPRNITPVKRRMLVESGAEVHVTGADFEEAALAVNPLAESLGYYAAHPANEPALINGVGSEFLEILERLPNPDVVILPIGAGSEAAAAVTVLRDRSPGTEVIAVQAERAPAAFLSWQEQALRTAGNSTFAGGLATGRGYELPFSIYGDQLADFLLLSEDELYRGVALAAYYTHNFVEAAGGAPLMAAVKRRSRLQGRRVVLQISGCNAAPDEWARAVALPEFREGLQSELANPLLSALVPGS